MPRVLRNIKIESRIPQKIPLITGVLPLKSVAKCIAAIELAFDLAEDLAGLVFDGIGACSSSFKAP